MQSLVIAECLEHKGRFTDEIVNGMVLILEESTWILPAHTKRKGNDPFHRDDMPYVDLFAAETAVHMAEWLYMLEKELTEFSPSLVRRIKTEIEKRVIVAVEQNLESMWWKRGSNMYANDNEGVCPVGLQNNVTFIFRWVRSRTFWDYVNVVHEGMGSSSDCMSVSAYVSKEILCPNAAASLRQTDSTNTGLGAGLYSYARNDDFGPNWNDPKQRMIKFSAVDRPSAKLDFMDGITFNIYGLRSVYNESYAAGEVTGGNSNSAAYRHGFGLNATFYDGHAEHLNGSSN